MGVNKVIYNGNTLIDVSQTNVAADKLLRGYSAIGPNGELIEGTFDVDEILSKLTTLQTDITNLNTNVNTVKTKVNTVNSNVSTNQTKLNNLQTSVNAIPTTGSGGGDRSKYSNVYDINLSAYISFPSSSSYSGSHYCYAYAQSPSSGMLIDVVSGRLEVTSSYSSSGSSVPAGSTAWIPSGKYIRVYASGTSNNNAGTESAKCIAYANSTPTSGKYANDSNGYASANVSTI